MSELVAQSVTSNGRSGRGIHKLPNETMNHIFLSGSLTLSTNPAKNTSPAFTLLLVCRRWKVLASALSPLWATLNLDRFYLEEKWGQTAAEDLLWKFANLCLSKSRAHPLHLTFCHSIGAPLEKLAQLGATSDRWVSLTLSSGTLVAILNDRKSFVGFPVLQYLETYIPSTRARNVVDIQEVAPCSDPGMVFPQLACFRFHLRLSSIGRASTQEAFLGLPDHIQKNVTHLSIERSLHLPLLPSRIHTVLTSNMDRLTHLHLKLTSQNSSDIPDLSSFGYLTLPRLVFISLDSPSCQAVEMRDDVWKILDCLRLPALEHLHIAQIMPEAQDPQINVFFTRFLSRCQQPIQTLALRQVSLKHSLALMEALKPEALFLANHFRAPMRKLVCNVAKGVVEGEEGTTVRLKRMVVCDLVKSGALLARDIVNTLVRCSRSRAQPGVASKSLEHPLKVVRVISLSRTPVPRSLEEYVKAPVRMAGVDLRLDFHAQEPSDALTESGMLRVMEAQNHIALCPSLRDMATVVPSTYTHGPSPSVRDDIRSSVYKRLPSKEAHAVQEAVDILSSNGLLFFMDDEPCGDEESNIYLTERGMTIHPPRRRAETDLITRSVSRRKFLNYITPDSNVSPIYWS
ncbi:hypothetical protein DFP72DRAFT_844822 [Ephemerocybe angulata]|uniref:F-box domain-containing protein n=1 Tax=Ephemerocybe angulata TaxID=980116 RepID=A0A8H6MCH6_9AGAR|nr:hypothetical protein DFP72DRAFT_844822 [Tulosesus angulatus]